MLESIWEVLICITAVAVYSVVIAGILWVAVTWCRAFIHKVTEEQKHGYRSNVIDNICDIIINDACFIASRILSVRARCARKN